jgi:hypothetical protein
MAIVPVPGTVNPGFKLTSTAWNREVRDAINFFLSNKPVCQLIQSTAQSIPTGSPTALIFSSAGDEVIDSDAQHDLSVTPSRVVIGKTLGLYRVTGAVAYTGNSTGTFRRCNIGFNGSQVLAGYGAGLQPNATFYSVNCGPFIVRATAATDYVELFAYHDAASSVLTASTTGLKSFLLVEWIGA